jgi:BirA family biotin operon repressor/biotin-[acetyl-CoA-carboxylase] ligase
MTRAQPPPPEHTDIWVDGLVRLLGSARRHPPAGPVVGLGAPAERTADGGLRLSPAAAPWWGHLRPVADFLLYPELGSTNDHLRALAEEGAPGGTLVLADRQTAGRGRHGRSWYSPPGGVYLSLLLRPDLEPALSGWITLAAALAVARAAGHLGAPTGIKWPNDVLWAGRKVAGVLAESTLVEGRIGRVVLGIGVNLAWGTDTPPAELADRAGTLEEAIGRPVDRDRLTADLLRELLTLLEELAETTTRAGGEPPPFAGEVEARLLFRGERVRIVVGEQERTGICSGLTPEGHLRLDGGEVVAAGELVTG